MMRKSCLTIIQSPIVNSYTSTFNNQPPYFYYLTPHFNGKKTVNEYVLRLLVITELTQVKMFALKVLQQVSQIKIFKYDFKKLI